MNTGVLRLLRKILVPILVIPPALIGIYFLAVLIGGLIRTADGDQAAEITIFFTDNDYHIELCLPARYCPFRAEIEGARGDSGPDGGYYCFGWGDRTFYPETPFLEDLNFRLVTKALFLPTSGAVRISFYRGGISGPAVRQYSVSRQQLDLLYQFIDDFLIRDETGAFITVDPETVNEVYGDSLFIFAEGTYSLFYTCNNWTSQALRQAGIRTGVWTPLAWKVLPDGL